MTRDEPQHDQPVDRHADRRGLHTPRGPLGTIERPRRWTPARLAVQVLGVLLSLGLLIWAATLALSEKNRESLDHISDAAPGPVAALLGLACLSVVANAFAFRAVLAPIRRLGRIDLVAITAIATLLAFLPFKLSLLSRVAIHRRKDGLRYKTIAAWFAALAAVTVAVLGPLALATLWRQRIDGLWVGGSTVGIAAGVFACLVGARVLRAVPALDTLTLGAADMLIRPAAVLPGVAYRVADVGLLAARFAVAASIAGVDMPVETAILAASVYFLAGIASPSGNLGVREGAVAGVGWLAIGTSQESLALVTLVVTGGEAVVALALGLAGAAWIRPHRLLAARPVTPPA